MKRTYTTLPAFAPQNVNLFLGATTGMNTDASLSHAVELLRSQEFGSILFINTVETPRSLYAHARSHGLEPGTSGIAEVDGNPHKLIQFLTIKRGDLHRSRERIDYLLSEDH